MNSQIIFNIDKKIKDKAMKKAKAAGVPLAAVLKTATQAYVEGSLNLTLGKEERFNAETRRILDRALKDIKEGKNLSPAFDTAEEAIAYLHSL